MSRSFPSAITKSMSNKKGKVVENANDSLFGEQDNHQEDGDTVESLCSTEPNKKLSFLLPKENDDFFDEQPENDDEQEIEREKKEAENRKRQEKEKLLNAKPKGSAFNDALKNLSPTALEDHYVKCIQLCSENKVNQKNAFKLQLIDCMKLIFENKSKKTDNLALMGCTLDASAKIYSYRVDKVYTDMMKFMTGKIFKEPKEDEDDNDGEKDVDGDETPKKKRKKNHVNGEDDEIDYGKFLCSEKELQKTHNDGESLLKERITLPPQYEFFLECPLRDPYGLLTLNPPIFDSEEEEMCEARVSISHFAMSSEVTLDPSQFIPYYDQMNENYFVVDESTKSVLVDKTLVYDPTIEPTRNYCAPGDDDMNIEGIAPEPIIDYDDDLSDCEDPMPSSSGSGDRSQPVNSTLNKTSFSVRGMSTLVSVEDNDYSYFDSSKLNFWAGPSHWTIKPKKRGLLAANNEAAQVVPSTCKSVKKHFTLDFDNLDSDKMLRLFSESSQPLSRKTLESWTKVRSRSSTQSYTVKHLLSLFSNDNWSFMNKDFTAHGVFSAGKCKLDESTQELSPDSFNCRDDDDEAEMNMLDDHPADTHDDEPGSSNFLHEYEIESGLELIPVPNKVNQIAINYSKCQKSVDIKALKNTIWNYMDLDNTAKENIPPSDDSSGKQNSGKGTMTFSEVFKAVHEAVPSEERSSYSPGVVFMSLLHMANEKVLCLEGLVTLDDFNISLCSQQYSFGPKVLSSSK